MKRQNVEYVGQIVTMLCECFGIRHLKCATYFFSSPRFIHFLKRCLNPCWNQLIYKLIDKRKDSLINLIIKHFRLFESVFDLFIIMGWKKCLVCLSRTPKRQSISKQTTSFLIMGPWTPLSLISLFSWKIVTKSAVISFLKDVE